MRGIARDPAMLLYLDSATNRKMHPNENFAREVMELFCLGVGNYTEQRHPGAGPLLHRLGNPARRVQVQPVPARLRQQDRAGQERQVRRRRGAGGDPRAAGGGRVHLRQAGAVFRRRRRADFRRSWIAPLASKFREAKLTVAPVLETIFTSRLFYSDAAIGRKIRSPVELGVGLLRALDGTTNMVQLAEPTARAGPDAVLSAERQGLGRRPGLDQLLDAAGPGEPGPLARRKPRRPLFGGVIARSSTSTGIGSKSPDERRRLPGRAAAWPCRSPTTSRSQLVAAARDGGQGAPRAVASKRCTCSVRCRSFNLPDATAVTIANELENCHAHHFSPQVPGQPFPPRPRRRGLVSLSPQRSRFLARVSRDGAEHAAGEKILVVVQLSGGNDGLNTVVPYTDEVYRRRRPSLAIGDGSVLKIDDGIGLHPA